MINELLSRVENMEHTENLSKLHRLEKASFHLQQDIQIAKEQLSTMESLVQNAAIILYVISSVSDDFDRKAKKTENDWVSFWGIAQVDDEGNFEMESKVL
jgi:hypothetical protein